MKRFCCAISEGDAVTLHSKQHSIATDERKTYKWTHIEHQTLTATYDVPGALEDFKRSFFYYIPDENDWSKNTERSTLLILLHRSILKVKYRIYIQNIIPIKGWNCVQKYTQVSMALLVPSSFPEKVYFILFIYLL